MESVLEKIRKNFENIEDITSRSLTELWPYADELAAEMNMRSSNMKVWDKLFDIIEVAFK